MTYVYCFKLYIAIEMFLNVSKHTSNCINFIKENYTSFLISGHFKQFSYHSGALQFKKKRENKWKSLRKNKSKSLTFIKLCRTTCICWYNDITDIHCHCMLFWTINRYFKSLIPRQHIFAPIPNQSHEWSRHLFYLPPHGHRVFFQSPEVQTTGLLSEARYQGSQNARAKT